MDFEEGIDLFIHCKIKSDSYIVTCYCVDEADLKTVVESYTKREDVDYIEVLV